MEFLKSAETYDLVFAFIAITMILGFGIFLLIYGIKGGKEKKLVEMFVRNNFDKIDYLKQRIMFCNSLDKFYLIKRWASVTVENLKNEMITISYDYGCEYGNKIIKDMNKLISIREEQLTSRVILQENQ